MAVKYRIAKPSDWIIMQVTTQAGKAVQQVNEYDVFLDVDFDALRFSGKVRIDISSTGDISLDAVDLEVTSVKTNDRTYRSNSMETSWIFRPANSPDR